MSVQIDSIFTASAKSTWEFLIEPGQGCYIPAYQRHYSWDSESIGRLLEDVVNGVSLVLERSEAISFLGTIIAIHDSSLKTVKPIYRTEVASKVMTIIDGQQRICTIVMINIALHDLIRRTIIRLGKQSKDDVFAWLMDFAEQTLVDLESTVLIDRQSGDPKYRYYPRVIRSISDAWSRRKGQAKYVSPIARFIWDYIEVIKADEPSKAQFKHDPRDAAGEKLQDHQGLVDGFRYIQTRLRNLSQAKAAKTAELPDLLVLTQNDKFWTSLVKYPLPENVKRYVVEQQDDRFYEDVCSLLRLIAVARYLNYRVALTIVTTSNEDDAFDMFEALNTTGEPLTAFETFKPRVIDSEGHENYETSPSMGYVDQVEDYLKRFRKADDRQRATTDMLLPFALSESGAKIQKKLTDQRRYLRDEYEDDTMNKDSRRAFIKALAQLATFMRLGWDVEKGRPLQSLLVVSDPDALVGFQALRGLKHTITIAPLVRFYQQALDSEDCDKKARTEEFVAAIKATVAFSMLWRGAMGGTENIDAFYRDIMRTGVKVGQKQIPPIGRRVKGAALSLKNYKEMLAALLGDKADVATKASWVKAASQVGIYEHSTVVARFLTFAACDDAMPDPKAPGLIVRGRKGLAPMLTPDVWENESYLSLEHIAPQAKSPGWDSSVYEDTDRELVHRLGNLTLLPDKENNVISNRSWDHKQIFYGMLSSETPDKLEEAKKRGKAIGLTLSKTAEEVIQQAKYLGLCKSLAECQEPWTRDLINARSERLCGLAWDRIAPWLLDKT